MSFQGELGAYSELAAREFFDHNIEVEPLQTFDAVFESVESGKSKYGIIPIENSLAGSVHQNYDLFLEHDLFIVGETKLRIIHNLISNPGAKVEDIKVVYSHPQAISQCRDFLKSLEGVEVISVYDTAGAAKLVRDRARADETAIASSQAASDYGLEILRSGIESNHKNFTRFLAIAKEPKKDNKNPKTSIVFSTKNIPGALFKSLSVFALRDIDLMKIESRPIHGSPWQYLFYLDFDGDISEERCGRAIEHLKEIAIFFKFLGSYDKGVETNGKIHNRQGCTKV